MIKNILELDFVYSLLLIRRLVYADENIFEKVIESSNTYAQIKPRYLSIITFWLKSA